MRRISLLVVLSAYACVAQAQNSERIRDVVYGYKSGMALTMDVFKPKTPNGIAVIWMVSGGWVSDQKNISPEMGMYLADHGYTMFQVCHGSQPKFTIPEIFVDVTRSVRFIRFNASKYGIDPQKLAVAGGSAGGHLSLMLASHGAAGDPEAKDPIDRVSSEIQAVCAFFPPTDFRNFGKSGVSAIEVPMLRGFWPAFGVTASTPKEKIVEMSETLSPYTAFTAKMPPTLFIHGDADPLVPIQQSKWAVSKLEELKVPVQLNVRPGKGHGWADMVPDLMSMLEWFDKYLGKKS